MGLLQIKWKVKGAHCPLAGVCISKLNSRKVTKEDERTQKSNRKELNSQTGESCFLWGCLKCLLILS